MLFNAPAIRQDQATQMLERFRAGLQQGQADLPTGKPILKMSQEGPNAGKFIYGQGQTLLKEGTVLAANPSTFMQGWICWKGGRKAGEQMVPWGSPLPPESGLMDHGPYEDGEGWSIQYSVELAVLNEPALQFYYGANSMGGRKFIHNLVASIGMQMEINPQAVVPLFVLHSTSYKSRRGRTVYNPEFTLTGWADMNGNVIDDTAKLPAADVAPASGGGAAAAGSDAPAAQPVNPFA